MMIVIVIVAILLALTNAKNMFNLVRTFGDEELKATFAKLVIEKLPDMLAAVQARINEINTIEAFETSDETKCLSMKQ